MGSVETTSFDIWPPPKASKFWGVWVPRKLPLFWILRKLFCYEQVGSAESMLVMVSSVVALAAWHPLATVSSVVASKFWGVRVFVETTIILGSANKIFCISS